MNYSKKTWFYSLKKPVVKKAILLFASFTLASLTIADEYWPTTEWRTASPENQGMSSKILSDMMELIFRKDYQFDSILIVRNGHAVLDAYRFPLDPGKKHHLFSCTKSVTATLIGIAIDQGLIESVNQPILDFFNHHKPKLQHTQKRQITLKNTLNMATGLDCRDSFLYSWKGLRELRASKDWIQHMFDLPLTNQPGTRFEYCNGASFLLTAALEEVAKKPARDFANENLFAPLGIKDYQWAVNHSGQTIGWADLHLRPRDMARIGYLYLKKGKWQNKQIVSSNWIVEATSPHMPLGQDYGYGYQWWTDPDNNYIAMGYKGQRIFVLDDEEMVVVVTASFSDWDRFLPSGILENYMLPSIKSDASLPENPKAWNKLQKLAADWQTLSTSQREIINKNKIVSGYPNKTYQNKEYGFSFEYDPEFRDSGNRLSGSQVFRRSGIKGFPILKVMVEKTPPGLKLEDSDGYLIEILSKESNFRNYWVTFEESRTSPEGIVSHYFEMSLQRRQFNLMLMGTSFFKNGNILTIYTIGGGLEIPFERLKQTIGSLTFH